MLDTSLLLVDRKLLRHANRPVLRKFDGPKDGGRVAEHEVELLEVAAHGLGEEEVDGDGNAEGDASVDEVVLPSDAVQSNGSDHDDEEVPIEMSVVSHEFLEKQKSGSNIPDPMIRSGDRRHGNTETDGSDLSAVEEVGTQEADGDKEVEEVDEAASSNLSGPVRGVERSGDGQADHANAHAGTAEHEDSATTETINGEEGDERGQELPGQSTAGQNARQFGAHAKVLLEEDGSVDGNEVGAGHLLEELEEHAESEAIQELVLAHGEHLLHRNSTALGSLLEGELNASKLCLDLHGISVVSSEKSDGGASLVVAGLANEPPRRLGEEVNRGDQDEREEDGNGDRRTPGNRTLGKLEEAKVNPRFEEVTHADEETVENDMLASVLGTRGLALPYRHSTAELTNTETNDDAADNEVRKRKCGALQHFTDEGADGTSHDDGATAELLAGVGA